MKDYSMNSRNAKTFVLNYTVKDNQIIVHFANGENYVIPYTAENEVKLLKRMRAQVILADEFLREQEQNFSKNWKLVIGNAVMLAVNIFALVTGNSVVPILNGTCTIIFTYLTGSLIYSMMDNKRNIKDVKKNKILLHNEEKLNQKIKENDNVFTNTDEKMKEMVYFTPEDQPVFTFNSIDKMKYEELKKVLEMIELEEEYGFADASKVEEKASVFNKKLN